MIPLFHDLSTKRVVVIGGGRVALRKARRFADETHLTVISPAFHDGFDALDCELVYERVDERTIGDYLDEVFLVVPATGDTELNGRLAMVADRAGCLVNRVDRPDPDGADSAGVTGDVIVPGTIHTEEITVAIATGGSSPATSKYLRRRLEPIIHEADPMVRLQRDLREELKRTIDTSEERKQRLWAVIEDEGVWNALADDYETARSLAREHVGLEP